MGIETIIVGQDKTFKPVVLNIQITISDAQSLKALQKEFQKAELENYSVTAAPDQEDLELISDILKTIEEAL